MREIRNLVAEVELSWSVAEALKILIFPLQMPIFTIYCIFNIFCYILYLFPNMLRITSLFKRWYFTQIVKAISFLATNMHAVEGGKRKAISCWQDQTKTKTAVPQVGSDKTPSGHIYHTKIPPTCMCICAFWILRSQNVSQLQLLRPQRKRKTTNDLSLYALRTHTNAYLRI